MFNTEGTCDWCKEPKMVMKHNYVDGKHHHSCETCNDIATLDVRLFNIDELALRSRSSQSSAMR